MQYKFLIFPSQFFRNVVLIFVAVLITSCTTEPVDYIDEAEIFTSVKKLDQATLGIYEGWYPEYIIRISSLMTDECNIGAQNTGFGAAGQSIFRWTFTSDDDDILSPWKNGYEIIGRINKILKGIDTVPVKNEEEEQQRLSIKGELLAARAFVHFDLYRVYGYSGIFDATALAIPYIKISHTSNKPSRPSTELFFDDLWQDLKEAEELSPSDSNMRIGITAIESLHARIALYTRNYNEAANYAEKVINKVPLSDYTDFPLLWSDKKDGEVIFKLGRSNASLIRPGDLFYNISSDKILFTPSQKLLDLYDSNNDIRYKSWFEKDLEQNSYIIKKYSGTDASRNLNDVKVLRVGEMYLIRAEALLLNEQKELAQRTLNSLRMARINDYKNQSFDSSDDLLAAIIQERLIELPYEGHRYFDLKRLGKSIERPTNGSEGVQLLETTSLHYFIPIPHAEIVANSNIKPNNKGW